jgi:hypothetical protein
MLAEGIAVTETGQLVIGLGGLATLATIAATWGALRRQVDDLSKEIEDLARRLGKLEAWHERTKGAAAARAAVPSIRDYPDTAPIDVVQPRASEDSSP